MLVLDPQRCNVEVALPPDGTDTRFVRNVVEIEVGKPDLERVTEPA